MNSNDYKKLQNDISDQMMLCSKCRMCVAVCPTNEGWYSQSAYGRLSAIKLYFILGAGTKTGLSKLLYSCAVCRRCQEMCRMLSMDAKPSDIILRARELLVKGSNSVQEKINE